MTRKNLSKYDFLCVYNTKPEFVRIILKVISCSQRKYIML